MAASLFPSCAFEDDACEALASVGTSATPGASPYTFLQPKLDATGAPILDEAGIPVPDPTNPVVLTGSTMSAELRRGNTLLATFSSSTDGDIDLAQGKFKIVVPGGPTGITATRTFNSPRAPFPTRLIVIQTDALGEVTTLAVQPIAVLQR